MSETKCAPDYFAIFRTEGLCIGIGYLRVSEDTVRIKSARMGRGKINRALLLEIDEWIELTVANYCWDNEALDPATLYPKTVDAVRQLLGL
jgi:hypothetical protein